MARSARSFSSFAKAVDFPLERWQHRIVRAVYGPEREVLVLIPKGNGKTSLLAALALHELIQGERPAIYCGAASIAQARILFESARDLAAHPAVADKVVARHLELRRADGGGVLRMVPADGPRTHGISPSLAIVDELWSHRDAGLYESMRSSLVKRPDAKLVTLSTADVGADRPLSRLRARALAAPTVERRGGLTECSGDGLRALLYELDDNPDPDDLDAIQRVNPASWITREALAEQRKALPVGAYLRFHGCARVVRRARGCLRARGRPASASRASIRASGSGSASTLARRGATRRSSGSASPSRSAARSTRARTGCCGRSTRCASSRPRTRSPRSPPIRGAGGRRRWSWQREGIVSRSSADGGSASPGLPAAPRRDHRAADHAAARPDPRPARCRAVQRHGRRGWRLERASRSPEDAIDGLIALLMALDRRSRPRRRRG